MGKNQQCNIELLVQEVQGKDPCRKKQNKTYKNMGQNDLKEQGHL